MPDRERRKDWSPSARSLERELSEAQLITLRELERFGWELKFIRHPPFQSAVPVIFDPERKHFAVILPNGTLDEHPGFDIRH